jgi:hypothetical protein
MATGSDISKQESWFGPTASDYRESLGWQLSTQRGPSRLAWLPLRTPTRGSSCSRVREIAHRTRLLHRLEMQTKVPLVHAGPRNADMLGFRVLPQRQSAGKKGIISVAPEENGLDGTRWH